MKNKAAYNMKLGNPQDDSFLPDFCNVKVVFIVVVIAELLAFVIALSPLGSMGDRWSHLNLISLLIQWIALSSIAVLCMMKHPLSRLSNVFAAICSYLLVLLVTMIISEFTFLTAQRIDIGFNLPSELHADFLLRNLIISAIISAVALRYSYVQHRLKQNIEAESRARFQALQARIRPHFLFNSMNTIASLTRTSPKLAEEAVEDLADLFRVSLSDENNCVPIKNEIALVERYLRIEKLRLDQRLNVIWDIGCVPSDAQLPGLLIQPLIENAIYHGIEPRSEGGTIEISGNIIDNRIIITVTNPYVEHRKGMHHQGNKMALDNIRQRLETHFKGNGFLELRQSGDKFIVTLSFPYERME